MKIIQLVANKQIGNEIVYAATKEEAKYFSIYKGEPGNFEWVADFSDPDVAYWHASKWQIESKGAYRLDTAQFDVVMNPKPVPKFPEGFTEWRGGFCPVEPSQRVVAIRRDGSDTGPWAAHSLSWSHTPLVPKASDIVAYKVVEAAKPAKPTGHLHAALMAQYAEDARTNPEPWTLWQWRQKGNQSREWETCIDHPSWYCHLEFQRTPAQPAPPGDPTHCPFCGGNDVVFVNGITACLEGDPDNSLDLDEHQCRSASCGRSFWS